MTMLDATPLTDLGATVVPRLAIPLVVWTALALIAEAILGRFAVPAAGSLAVRRGVLFSLPLALLAPVLGEALAAPVATVFAAGGAIPFPELTVGPGLSDPESGWTVWTAWGLGVAVLIGTAIVALVRFGVALHRLARLRRAAQPAPAQMQVLAGELSAGIGLTSVPRVGVSEGDTAPFTLGARRPLVVVPCTLGGEALQLALVHEIAHVRRRDFAWTLAERAVVVLGAAHPLVHRLAHGAALDRECLADADVLSAWPGKRRAYADLLLRFASSPPPALAIGVSGLSPLKHRIAAMNHPTPPHRLRRARLAGRALASLVVALTLGVGLAGASPASEPPAASALPALGAERAVLADTTMPELIGGMDALQQAVVYPRIQREAGIEGRSFVQFVVTEDGGVRDLTVPRSSGDAALDAAAVAAVEAVRFRPGSVDGRPVAVRFVVPITFRLGDDPSAMRPPPPPPPVSPEDTMPELVGGLAALQQAVVYPEMQRRAGIEGTAFVEFVVDERGGVRDIEIARTSGDEDLDRAAVTALQTVVFRPGMKAGRAVPFEYIIPVRFALPDAEDR